MTRSIVRRPVEPLPSSPESASESSGNLTLIVLAVSGSIDEDALRSIRQRVDAPAKQLLRLIRAEPDGPAAASPASPDGWIRWEAGAPLTVGPLQMDLERVRVTVGERPVELTHQEFLLLEAFMRSPGRVLSRAQLIEQAWDYGDGGAGRTVDVHVRRIRVKLGPDAPMIATVRGFGYRLETA